MKYISIASIYTEPLLAPSNENYHHYVRKFPLNLMNTRSIYAASTMNDLPWVKTQEAALVITIYTPTMLSYILKQYARVDEAVLFERLKEEGGIS